MITDQEMLELIEKVSDEYTGQGDDLGAAIGILVLSRLFGWRVMRLISSRRHWQVATKSFGDIKKLTPERGKLARKSLGLKIADELGNYWDLITGKIKVIPEKTRKMIDDTAYIAE
jgi:hypothetical protein